MSTTDSVLLIVVTALLSILLLCAILLVVVCVKLVSSIREVVIRAEDLIDSVESAADVLRDTQGRMALFKLVRNVIKLVNKRL